MGSGARRDACTRAADDAHHKAFLLFLVALMTFQRPASAAGAAQPPDALDAPNDGAAIRLLHAAVGKPLPLTTAAGANLIDSTAALACKPQRQPT